MNITEFYHSAYKRDTEANDAKYKKWQSTWLSKFQRSKYAGNWPDVCDALLKALRNGKENLVIECFWASQIASEFHPDKFPSVVVWGMKRACSVASAQEIYDLLNVKLTVKDIRGETFYAGFPTPEENDIELGKLLNQIDIYKYIVGEEIMLKVYEFTVTLQGTGHDEEEAWRDAVEEFELDPGYGPENPRLIEFVEE
jgi:hypothetical protein